MKQESKYHIQSAKNIQVLTQMALGLWWGEGLGEELEDDSGQWAITIQYAAASIWKHW